jgi:hypothetical protein
MASAIPKNYPSWASWSSREVYLPAKFHSASSFDDALMIVQHALADSTIFESGKIDAPLLLLGLMHREVSRSMEIEPGGDPKLPDHLVKSSFGVKEIRKIERLLDKIHLPASEE